MNKHIIPAIIATNQSEFDQRILKVKDFVDIIQIDVMDERFVPSSSNNFNFILPKTSCSYEAHLMVANPKRWMEQNHEKVDTLLAHIESVDNPQDFIDTGKKYSKRVGFVLNPETKLDAIKQYLSQLDQVLIMTVNPGFYGSPFLPEMIDKIKVLRKMAPSLDIEVDGGITDKTISLVDEAGANMFVSGSYIVKSDNVQSAVNTLQTIITK